MLQSTRSTAFQQSSQIVRRAVDLAKTPTTNFFDLAKTLADVRNLPSGQIRQIAEKTGFAIRRLYYLGDVGQMLRIYRIGKAQAERIGWTKLSIVAGHVTKVDPAPDRNAVLDFLAKAEKHKARDLTRALREQDVSDSERAAVFHLSQRQRAVLEKTLLGYGATRKGRAILGKEKALIRALNASLKALGRQT